MTDGAFIQLVVPGASGAIAVGNDKQLHISWSAELPEDNGVTAIAQKYAQAVGLVLHSYHRAGMDRVFHERIRDLAEQARSIIPHSYQEYRKPGVDPEYYEDLPAPRLDPELGYFRVCIPGVWDGDLDDFAEWCDGQEGR